MGKIECGTAETDNLKSKERIALKEFNQAPNVIIKKVVTGIDETINGSVNL